MTKTLSKSETPKTPKTLKTSKTPSKPTQPKTCLVKGYTRCLSGPDVVVGPITCVAAENMLVALVATHPSVTRWVVEVV